MNKNSLIKIFLAIAFFSLFVLFVYLAKEASPNRGDAKLKELQQLSSEIPQYPSFAIVRTRYSSRYLDAGVYKYYSSTADYADVKNFYSAVLAQRGWTSGREEESQYWLKNKGRKTTFRKGELRIVIEFSGDETGASWNYAVNFLWK